MQKRDDQEVLVRCWKNKQCSSKCIHKALAPDHMSPRASNDHPPPTPHCNVVHPPGWPRQQTLFFCRRTSSPDKLQNNIERGGKGGRCGLYQELLVGRSQARFMTEHCLFFQHRELFESLHLILHASPGRPRTLDAQCRLCGFDECKVGEATEVAVQKMSGLGSPPRTDPGYPVLARMR